MTGTPEITPTSITELETELARELADELADELGAAELGAAEFDAYDAEGDLDDELEELELEEYEVEVELVVLDMAGTTVADDGTVERAFERVAERLKIGATPEEREEALEYVRVTMGQSKIEVFRAITGDEVLAQAANASFESAYAEIVAEEGVKEIPGARATIELLQAAGITVALTTGFARPTVDTILDALGWNDLADIVLTPADAGRGRPHPDLPLTALLRTETTSVDAMIVVGDTASDMQSGCRAGAGLVVGVLTGAHDEEQLTDAGAEEVLDSIVELPELLGLYEDDDEREDSDEIEDEYLAAEAAVASAATASASPVSGA